MSQFLCQYTRPGLSLLFFLIFLIPRLISPRQFHSARPMDLSLFPYSSTPATHANTLLSFPVILITFFISTSTRALSGRVPIGKIQISLDHHIIVRNGNHIIVIVRNPCHIIIQRPALSRSGIRPIESQCKNGLTPKSPSR